MDWGCGCGRVFRHFPQQTLSRLVGADVDSDNIEWCRRSFPGAQFHVFPLLPPTQLHSGDLRPLVGVSVFTHLREQAQLNGCRELSRICASGAFLLVTTHGPTAGARANLSDEQRANGWKGDSSRRG